ncbi:hypothetical protein BU198_09680 [Streptomyces sp. CBMA156]|nr:hypothetical protein [Streptomyces sp. CBMA156]MBD0670969.1 hypothetical protein [Streptomyces sp. CBMA156]
MTPTSELIDTHSPIGSCEIEPEGAVASCRSSVTSSTGNGEHAVAAVGEPRYGRGRRRDGLG